MHLLVNVSFTEASPFVSVNDWRIPDMLANHDNGDLDIGASV